MPSSDYTEEEFRQFIEFGQVFDKPTRRYLVLYLRNKFFPDPGSLSQQADTPDRAAYGYMKAALDKIFADPALLQAASGNEVLASQVMHDTLSWLRKARNQLRQDNPLQDEFKRLQSWKDRPLLIFSETWYHLTNWLKEKYSRPELDISFYEKHFNETFRDRRKFSKHLATLTTDQQEALPIQVIINDLLAQWEGLLTAKSLQYELETMQQLTDSFAGKLCAKIAEYVRMTELIAPFAQEIGRFWDMSRGIWKETHFNVLSHYALLLSNEKSVRQLADLLGRLREAQTEIAEESYDFSVVSVSYRTTFDQHEEIGGIHESDQLSSMLPAEAALLANEATQMAFFKRYADKQLLTYQYQGQEPVTGREHFTEKREKTRQKEKGPFIVCVDVSGSMEGTPEQVAKVLCFALLKMAARDKRKAYLISFATGLQTINLLNLEDSLDQVVQFLTMTFSGGTDMHPPMFEALQMLQSQDYKDADVLVVSDFIMYDVREDLQKRMNQERRKGTAFHSLTVTEGAANLNVAELFDNFWVYNPTSKEIMRQLAQDLEALD